MSKDTSSIDIESSHYLNPNQEDQTHQTEHDLRSYKLARDRQRRKIKPPDNFGQTYMIYYSLAVDEQLEHRTKLL